MDDDDQLQDAADEVIDAAETVLETELDRIMIYGAVAILVAIGIGFAMGWIGKAAKGSKTSA
jgi:hypothetical protein